MENINRFKSLIENIEVLTKEEMKEDDLDYWLKQMEQIRVEIGLAFVISGLMFEIMDYGLRYGVPFRNTEIYLVDDKNIKLHVQDRGGGFEPATKSYKRVWSIGLFISNESEDNKYISIGLDSRYVRLSVEENHPQFESRDIVKSKIQQEKDTFVVPSSVWLDALELPLSINKVARQAQKDLKKREELDAICERLKFDRWDLVRPKHDER